MFGLGHTVESFCGIVNVLLWHGFFGQTKGFVDIRVGKFGTCEVLRALSEGSVCECDVYSF